jgi:hypothetical protein
MKHRRFFLIFLLAVFIFLLGIGCESEMKDPKGTLEKQAKQYWTERLINQNFEYTYEEEAKDNLPPFSSYKEQLRNVTRFPTSSVEVKEVQVEGDMGTVKLAVMCIVPGFPKKLPLPLGDQWILKGNKWRHKRQLENPEKK